ncbi:MAG TPA: hypothetical protein VJJ47_00975 [Candidatus Paceibacterota bacterium]
MVPSPRRNIRSSLLEALAFVLGFIALVVDTENTGVWFRLLAGFLLAMCVWAARSAGHREVTL